MKITTWTCDRCNCSATSKEGFFVIEVSVADEDHFYHSSAPPVVSKALWCLTCCKDMHVEPYKHRDPNVERQEPSLEDLVRGIAAEVVEEATGAVA